MISTECKELLLLKIIYLLFFGCTESSLHVRSLVAVSKGYPLAAHKGFSLHLCYRARALGHTSSEVAPLGSRAQAQ